MSNVPMTRPEGAIAKHEFDFPDAVGNMWSTFLELQDRRVLQIAETNFTYSDDGGVTWSEPTQRRDTKGELVGGTSLVRLQDESILLKGSRRDREERLYFWLSKDEGETWAQSVHEVPDGAGKNILKTSSGRLVLPGTRGVSQRSGPERDNWPRPGKLVNGQWVKTSGHTYDPSLSCSFVCYSDDDGETWQTNKDGGLFVLLEWNTIFSYTNEPSVTEVAPGLLLLIVRTGLGRLYQSWSHDNGETWTWPAPTSLASSTAPAQIRSLPNGHLLCVWNQQSQGEIERGYLRTRLSSAISRNGGSAWEFFQNIESIHEETRVVPGPIKPVRPAEYHFEPEVPAPELAAENVTPVTTHGMWTYPSVVVMEDRVFISYRYNLPREDSEYARLVSSSERAESMGFILKVKVLPLSWFYAGKKPADNPLLPTASRPEDP